jgi:hypothetical protein
LIERHICGAGKFLAACDAESGELQQVSCDFCDKRGNVELKSVRAGPGGGDAVDDGGFLYIDSITVDKKHREGALATEVAAAAVRHLLTSTELADRWSIAVYVAPSPFVNSDVIVNNALC